ncbi:hypothetical protein Ddye_002153 [Dipteronia dyeriana]|uniref:Uncharacterized protein n=1 Tax=Dipteronia dyeriana TaxID=168575 RepID=A0AAE0CU75_9ROSI|nr:hypothetical protein Ddye_002153 [Dipteronia dyeriana]
MVMDPEKIACLCTSLSFQSKDEKLWSVRDTLKETARKKLDLCLVDKILSNKHVNREAFKLVIPRIWKTAQVFAANFRKLPNSQNEELGLQANMKDGIDFVTTV